MSAAVVDAREERQLPSFEASVTLSGSD